MKRAHAKSVSNFHSGKKLSDTQMEKRRKNPPNAKKVIINDIEFLSIRQASEHYNVSKVLIRQFIRGEISYEYLSDKDYRLKLKIEKQRKTLKENINKIPKNERTYAARYGEQKAKEIIEKQNKHKYNKKFSDETKKKISEAAMGRPAPNKGKKMSDESKKKLSEARKGKHISKNNYKLIDNEMNEYIIMKIGLREFFKRKFGGGVPSSIKRSLKTKEPVQRGRWKGWIAYVL